MDIDMGTGQIFLKRVGYEENTTRTLPALLTSLVGSSVHTLCELRLNFIGVVSLQLISPSKDSFVLWFQSRCVVV